MFCFSANSPKKLEDKGAEIKEDLKLEENSEAFVNSLPLPEAMPHDEEGNIIDTRIPIDLKPSGKSKSLDLLLNVCISEQRTSAYIFYLTANL